jgi:hypothetical protein
MGNGSFLMYAIMDWKMEEKEHIRLKARRFLCTPTDIFNQIKNNKRKMDRSKPLYGLQKNILTRKSFGL